MQTNAQCLTCGKPIFVPNSLRGRKKYCSKQCKYDANKRRVSLTCEVCGKEFDAPESRSDRRYCSRECYSRSQTSLDPQGMRKCTTCQSVLPATPEYFGRTSNTELGLSSQCKQCLSERNKKLKSSRKQLDKEILNEYRKKNPERVRQWKRESYLRNRETAIQKSREYRQLNPGKVKPTTEQQRVKSAMKRARKKSFVGRYSKQDVADKLVNQAGKCFYCSAELTDYHVDHYIPLSRGGTNWPDNIVLACPECNLAKGNMMPQEFIESYLPISIKLRTSANQRKDK